MSETFAQILNKTKTAQKYKQTKNAPLVMPTNIPVSRTRQVVQVRKDDRRDPRFDDLSGELKTDVFEKSYSFMNEIFNQEKQELMHALAKTKNPEEQSQIKMKLEKMQNKERQKNLNFQKKEITREWMKKEADMVKNGLKRQMFFPKKRELNRLQMIAKYRQLSDDKLEKVVQNKRKRNKMHLT